MAKFAFHYLPDSRHNLLLKASLLDGDSALDSWRKWRRCVALDDIDHGAARLLPLLLANLQRLGVRDPELRRYQNVARHAWLESQLLAKHAASILRLFEDASIPAMPIKGLALAPVYYGNFRLRPMSDIDILVPVAAARDAADLLASQGWRSQRQYRMRRQDYFTTHHSSLFTNTKDVQLDLHWHVFEEGCRPGADDGFWTRSQPMMFNDVRTRSLCATDQLFHALVHGGRVNRVAPFRWVTDCAMILRKAAVDWDQILSQARVFGVSLRVRRMVLYLQAEMELPIPPESLAALRALPVTGTEKLEVAIDAIPLAHPAKLLLRRYAHYRRIWQPDGKGGFLDYLNASYGTQSIGHTIRWAVQQMLNGTSRPTSRKAARQAPADRRVVEAIDQDARGNKEGYEQDAR